MLPVGVWDMIGARKDERNYGIGNVYTLDSYSYVDPISAARVYCSTMVKTEFRLKPITSLLMCSSSAHNAHWNN